MKLIMVSFCWISSVMGILSVNVDFTESGPDFLTEDDFTAGEKVVVEQGGHLDLIDNQTSLFDGDMAGIHIERVDGKSPVIVRDGEDSNSTLLDPRIRHSARASDSYKWPKGILPYRLDQSFSSSRRAVIARAIKDLEAKTCLRFVPYNGAKDRIFITPRQSGCYSYVGRIGNEQPVNLGGRCADYMDVVQHEILHAIGFYHEHNRPDRDKFIQIQWANIRPGLSDQFQKAARSIDYGNPYDFVSVMHYSPRHFSNGGPTIAPQSGYAGQKIGGNKLTAIDIDDIQDHYKAECAQREVVTTTTTTQPTTTTTTTTTPKPTTTLPRKKVTWWSCKISTIEGSGVEISIGGRWIFDKLAITHKICKQSLWFQKQK